MALRSALDLACLAGAGEVGAARPMPVQEAQHSVVVCPGIMEHDDRIWLEPGDKSMQSRERRRLAAAVSGAAQSRALLLRVACFVARYKEAPRGEAEARANGECMEREKQVKVACQRHGREASLAEVVWVVSTSEGLGRSGS